MWVLLKRMVGAIQRSIRGEGGRRCREGLRLEKSLNGVKLLLLLLLLLLLMMMMVMMMMMINGWVMLLMLLLMVVVVEKMVMVVVFQRKPIVTKPVFRGLGHSLKHSYDPADPPRPLHELLNGRALLRLVVRLLLLLLS